MNTPLQDTQYPLTILVLSFGEVTDLVDYRREDETEPATQLHLEEAVAVAKQTLIGINDLPVAH